LSVIILTTLVLLLAFSLPIISGLFARRMGRPFYKWFIIGIFLPFISIFIIFFLPDLSEGEKFQDK